MRLGLGGPDARLGPEGRGPLSQDMSAFTSVPCALTTPGLVRSTRLTHQGGAARLRPDGPQPPHGSPEVPTMRGSGLYPPPTLLLPPFYLPTHPSISHHHPPTCPAVQAFNKHESLRPPWPLFRRAQPTPRPSPALRLPRSTDPPNGLRLMFVLIACVPTRRNFPRSRVLGILWGGQWHALCWALGGGTQVSRPGCPASPAERHSGDEPAGPGAAISPKGPQGTGPGLRSWGAAAQCPLLDAVGPSGEDAASGEGSLRGTPTSGKAPGGCWGQKTPPEGPGSWAAPTRPGGYARFRNSESWEAPTPPSSQGSECVFAGGESALGLPSKRPILVEGFPAEGASDSGPKG